MHGENNLGVPAFLAKLWRLVEDAETNELISWSQDGKSFIIQNQAKFAKDLLPLNYKHNNMASFIRQLNMYGFHKITSIDNGGLKFDKDEMEFSHPYFQQGHPYLLEHIKRKIANTKQVEVDKTAASKVETMNRVLHEVKSMRGRQDSLDTRFSSMKQENEALWREVAILRQKHLKQQQIVNKLIQFLVTLVQPQRSGSLGSGIGKRRYQQLMINDAPQSKKVKKPNAGPIIRELTEDLLDEVDSDLETDTMNFSNVRSPSSKSSLEEDMDDLEECETVKCLEMMDEIDTSKMNEYCGKFLKKKNRRSDGKTTKADAINKQPPKQESKANTTTAIPSHISTAGKSLLLPSSNDNNKIPDISLNVLNEDDDDPFKNVMEDAIDSNICEQSTSAANSLVTDNINNYDETSQHANILTDDDLFTLVDKKDDEKTGDDMLSVIKYKPANPHHIMTLKSVEDYSNHIDNVQSDLDSLKDLLHNDAYQLETNQLLGNGPVYSMPFGSYDLDTINKLFGNDDLIEYEMSPANMELFNDDNNKDQPLASAPRSNLIAYQTSPFNNNLDLSDLLSTGDDKV